MQDCRFLMRPFERVSAGLTEDGFTSMYDSFSFQPGPFLATGSQKTFMNALIAEIHTALMYWHVGDETELVPTTQSQLNSTSGASII